ncbi:MAG: double-strand break repair helicase AddA [Marinosulfonomonas sp.]|nr:double-strand break repair helicase AddA [Marinosulfonomonas sp.]
MMRRDEATERQVQAANPGFSTWLSANAGSGKTRVLTDRVARLLLEGVLPQHILCLTYTKAAASEMQNRLFKRLGIWAMQDADELAAELRELGVDRAINKDELRKARTLFAGALEAPGGLKIQTIHSFCASLLRRFPLEAGISPQFTEMDERAANLLRAEIVEEMAGGADVAAVDALAAHYNDTDFGKLTAEIAKHRDVLGGEVDAQAIWDMFDLKPETSKTGILSSVILGDEHGLLSVLLPALKNGSANDQKAAVKLATLNAGGIRFADLEILESAFLTGGGAKEPFTAKIGSFPTKATQVVLGNHLDQLNDLMGRVEAARKVRISLYAAQKTLALHQFSHTFLPLYETRKQQKGWLDFDDLIDLTAKLLNNSYVAQWVLYRLDGGIDHILVDEAQDTSPRQWDVIVRLAQEFTTGEGAQADRLRTIFAVGDEKQSIYSFQGADPDEFDRMKNHFSEKMAQVDAPFQAMQLEHSFRSAEPIMRLVDLTFQDRADKGLGGEVMHRTSKPNMPGRVDHWPIVEKANTPEKRAWSDPTDKPADNHETVVLAKLLAEHISQMCRNGALIPEEISNTDTYRMRPVTEGDFLILVRRRSRLFHEIIRACKQADLAIAGADRLKIGAELAVKDLTALLSFLATPEDDLSLACALRSPLFSWSEQDLFDLAHKRPDKSFLWTELRNRREGFPKTLEMIDALRKDADYLRPFELLERVLTRFNGRKNLLARLGGEAEDGIDALLSQAMSFERMGVPSLTGFITWLQAEDVEIKRQLDGTSDRIRVMTVHGAKGLESPIVVLPDTADWDLKIRDQIYPAENGGVMWQINKDNCPGQITAARDKLRHAAEQERVRLLYVAMTRAEKWLIVCGAGNLKGDGSAWHAMIEAGMKTAHAEPFEFNARMGLRLQFGNWGTTHVNPEGRMAQSVSILPKWAVVPADTPERAIKTFSPSGLGGAKALAGETDGLNEQDAMQRGSYIHLLLEHLPNHPKPERDKLAKRLLPSIDQIEFASIYKEVTAVLDNPDLALLFTNDALAEAPISASLSELGGARIHGEIDRLLIFPTRILAVDFKSNAIVPTTDDAVPDGLLRQLGTYCAALEQIFPNHTVETAILWTRTATLMTLKHGAVAAALRSTTLP